MRDLTIALENRPGALAAMGEALGGAGVSIEGGGAFVWPRHAMPWKQEPGQLGAISRRMAEAGVNIEVLVDDIAAGRQVSEAWTREWAATPEGGSRRETASL